MKGEKYLASIWDESEVLIWRTCWGTHCELGEHIEPIRNLEGTPWEHIGKRGKMEKNKSFPPSKLKRNKSKAPWAFPLPERKTNPPPPPNKTCMESPCPSGHWTVHYPHQIELEKKPPLKPPTNPQIWEPSHLSY